MAKTDASVPSGISGLIYPCMGHEQLRHAHRDSPGDLQHQQHDEANRLSKIGNNYESAYLNIDDGEERQAGQ